MTFCYFHHSYHPSGWHLQALVSLPFLVFRVPKAFPVMHLWAKNLGRPQHISAGVIGRMLSYSLPHLASSGGPHVDVSLWILSSVTTVTVCCCHPLTKLPFHFGYILVSLWGLLFLNASAAEQFIVPWYCWCSAVPMRMSS